MTCFENTKGQFTIQEDSNAHLTHSRFLKKQIISNFIH